MIRNKKELEFYIKADRIMNGYPTKAGLKERIKRVIQGGDDRIPSPNEGVFILQE